MTRFHMLATVLTLAAFAGPLSAQTVTNDQLGKVLNSLYKVEEKKEKATYFEWLVPYTPPGRKQNFNWRVQANIVNRGEYDTVRLYFNCLQMPAKPNPEKLAKMLEWSGGHDLTRAFFKTFPNDKGQMLAIVLDLPPSEITPEKFGKAVDGMMKLAFDTMHLWTAPGDPLATETKPAPKAEITIKDLAGSWKGDVKLNGKKVGEWATKIEPDGFLLVTRVNTTVADPKPDIMTGKAKFDGGKLKINYDKGADGEETYDVELKDDTLTLIMKRDKDELRFELKK